MSKVSSLISPKGIAALSMLTLFSCSIPFFGKGQVSQVEGFSEKNAVLSGVIDFKEGCAPGCYKIVLKGLFENGGVQIEAQSDSTGRFSVTAPPGKYVAQVAKDDCGAKEPVELEKNTEHMLSFVVQEVQAIEKSGEEHMPFPSRLPASILSPSSK